MDKSTLFITLHSNEIEISDFEYTFIRQTKPLNIKQPLNFKGVKVTDSYLYHCQLDNIDNISKAFLCKTLFTLANNHTISVYVCTVDNVTQNIETYTNDYQPFFNLAVKQLPSVKEERYLFDIRYFTLTNWLQAKFSYEQVNDIANGNISKWISFDLVNTLYRRYHPGIWLTLTEQFEDSEHNSIFDYLRSIATDTIKDDAMFKQFLVHFALQDAARSLI